MTESHGISDNAADPDSPAGANPAAPGAPEADSTATRDDAGDRDDSSAPAREADPPGPDADAPPSRGARSTGRLAPGTCRREKVVRVGPDGEPFPFHAAFLIMPGEAITISDHVMRHYCIHYFLAGRGLYRDANGCEAPIRPGSLLQRIPRLVHSFDFAPGQDVALASLSFPPETFDVIAATGLAERDRPAYALPLEQTIVNVFEAVGTRYRAAPWEQLPFAAAEAVAAAMDLLRRARQAETPEAPPLLADACRLLETDPARRLVLPEVAGSLRMPYSTFRQWFKARTGVSPGAYRLAYRLRRARELIADGRFTLAEVAQRLGYPDYAGFARQFTRHTGQSPSHFARQHGPEGRSG